MNILMMTNTYKPILGGLEKSVESLTEELRLLGHRVIIVAPEYEGMVPEEDVIRVPAVQRFNGTEFSVELPISQALTVGLGDFRPDIVHAHHPFLIGDTALRVASKFNVPLVFTHHSLYEQNIHYVPGNEEALKKFVIELSTGYANLADQVFAPSESVMRLIKERGVTETPIEVVPTGIWINEFSRGAGKGFRKKYQLPADAFVVGHLGRLAPEKNLDFLCGAVMQFLKENVNAHFLVVGKGPSEENIKIKAEEFGITDRVHLVGPLQGKDKVDAYYAMDVFAFTSPSETQGLVLTEALAARVPIVAVDACGVREVVEDKINGRLLMQEDGAEFVNALMWMMRLSSPAMAKMKKTCRLTAQRFDMPKTVAKALEMYVAISVRQGFTRRGAEESAWARTFRIFKIQGGIVKNLTKAASSLFSFI